MLEGELTMNKWDILTEILWIDKPVRNDLLKDGKLQRLARRYEKFNPGNNYRMIKEKPLLTKRNYLTNHRSVNILLHPITELEPEIGNF